MFPTLDTEAIMEMDVEYLEEKYNTEIHVIAMDTEKILIIHHFKIHGITWIRI